MKQVHLKSLAITLSAICLFLTLLLSLSSFLDRSEYRSWWCFSQRYAASDAGVVTFTSIGFALLAVAILSAGTVLLSEGRERKKGALTCLIIGLLMVPCFWVLSSLLTFICGL